MNNEVNYRVYIVRHQTPLSYGSFLEGDEGECNMPALEPSFDFLDFLRNGISGFGELFIGPSRDTEAGIVTEHVLCLFRPWPELWNLTNVQVRIAESEIFEGAEGILFLQENALIVFQGEVLEHFFDNQHGTRVPDLDADLTRRLRRFCRHECSTLGYNGAAYHKITPLWIEAVWTSPPHEWTWSWLKQELLRIVEQFHEALVHGQVWYVYERMNSDIIDLPIPVVDGNFVKEVIEAALDDLPGVRQWLVQSSELYEYMKSRAPEHETVRRLDENEVFWSCRGAVWIHQGHGVQLGEIASDIVANSHGEIVPDLAEQAMRKVEDIVLAEIEKQFAGDDLLEEIFDILSDVLDEDTALEMWYESIPKIKDKALNLLGL